MKRLHSFLFFIFLFTGLLFAVTCKKEYSYEGGENAQYSFVGSPNACIELVVQGNFVVGVPTVDSVNTIQLHINVTSPGLLTVTTNVVDGIYFSTGKLNITDTAFKCWYLTLVPRYARFPLARSLFTFPTQRVALFK